MAFTENEETKLKAISSNRTFMELKFPSYLPQSVLYQF